MKRSEALDKMAYFLERRIAIGTGVLQTAGPEFMDFLIKELGMLPPTQAPSLVEDTRNGGIKHGPAERVWDEEYDSGKEMDRQMAIGGQTYPAEVYANITKEEWEEAQAFDPEEKS